MSSIFCLACLTAIGFSMNRGSVATADETPPDSVSRPPAVATRPKPPVPSAEEIAQLVADLNAADYSVREAATAKLTQIGAPAAEQLAQAALGPNVESAVRSIRILEAMYVQGDETDAEAAETAFDSLRSANNPTATNRAEETLEANYNLRQRRAVARIEELGGTVKFNHLRVIDPTALNGVERQIEHIAIGRKWEGGDEGLKHVARLKDLRVLYLVAGNSLSQEGLDQLQANLPDLRIEPRPPAKIGVAGISHPEGCQINEIQPGTAAAKSDLEPGDVITHFNGDPVFGTPDNFKQLIKLIGPHDPGEEIELDILRGSEKRTVKVVLGDWSR